MRCYAPRAAWRGEAVRLDAGESHHLVHVQRCRRGGSVEVFDGEGRYARAVVEEADGRAALLRVVAAEATPRSRPRRVLVAAPPKGDRAEWVCQKAVELGCDALRWIGTRRGVVRLEGARAAKRMERFRSVAVGAAKQCGALWLPEIAWYPSVEHLVAEREPDEAWLLCHVGAGPRLAFRKGWERVREASPASVAVWIGPEGDFDGEEVGLLLRAGAIAVDLGPRVLRAETAALYALAVLSSHLDAAGQEGV